MVEATSRYTMKAVGMGAGVLCNFFLATRRPGMIVLWHSGQYSLKRANHSSKQPAWKAWEHRSPRTFASSTKLSRHIALRLISSFLLS